MRNDLDVLLCEKYPLIFKDRHAPPPQSSMFWGFSCADGWFDLIDALCGAIQIYINNTKANIEYWNKKKEKGEVVPNWVSELTEVPQVVAVQVKEKFGTLRFYYNGGDDIVDGMVRMAESMSKRVCEECGSPGTIRGGSWIRTLCDEHAQK